VTAAARYVADADGVADMYARSSEAVSRLREHVSAGDVRAALSIDDEPRSQT
jgi:hypothetical protein